MKSYVVGMIFARGGSKGVPRKNLRLLGGKPLLAHAIDAARASRTIDRVIVSTDDPEIAEVAKQCGAEVPFMRPSELAHDDSPEWLAWQHALRTLSTNDQRKIDVFASIPPTSPLRSSQDIDASVQALQAGDADIVITVKAADRNPYFNMVWVDEEGYARLVIESEGKVHRRQDAPLVYDVTTVAYAARPEFVLRANSIFEGRVKAVVVPAERALDIDTELDFQFAEFLMTRTFNATERAR